MSLEPKVSWLLSYSYLWADEHRRGAEEGVKNRPCLGDKLPAFGVRQRGGDRDLDPELVRPVGLALADSLHLGCVQRIDFGAALALGLIVHAAGQRQDASEHHLLKPCG